MSGIFFQTKHFSFEFFHDFLFRCLSARWFLTIVARNQLFIATVLESRHGADSEDASSSSMASQHIGPSRFYIEEIQDTLDHLQSGGVENLANTWINANKRPEVTMAIFSPSLQKSHLYSIVSLILDIIVHNATRSITNIVNVKHSNIECFARSITR